MDRIDLGTFALQRAIRAVRRFALAIVTLAALGGLLAYVVSEQLPAEYVATAQLYVAPASNQVVSVQDLVAGTSVARSYAQLVTTNVVLRSAMEAVTWTDPNSFRERAAASQLRDTSIIAVTFRDGDPERAARAANAIAHAFIEQNQTLLSTIRRPAVIRLDEQIRAVEADISGLDARIAELSKQEEPTLAGRTPAPANPQLQAQITQLDGARQTKQQTLAQLLKARDDMDLASARAESIVTLYDPATPPLEPAWPRVLLNTVVGTLAVGLVALFALAIDGYVREGFTGVEAIAPSLGIVALGDVPLTGRRRSSPPGALVVRDDVNSPAAEAFRSLRTSILSVYADRRPVTIVVTSARAGEGKSFVTANLALALAEGGTPTVLVDADLRHPTQHLLFGIDRAVGLTSLLEGTSSVEALHPFVGSRLTVIPAGPPTPNPSGLLASERVGALLRDLASRDGGSVVVIDSSPVLSFADPLTLVTKAGGCLLVADASRGTVGATRRALASLRRVNAVVLGAVLNRVPATEDPYSYTRSERRGSRVAAGKLVDATTPRG